MPERPWYMGDIPHGWACAEFMMLLRDILFFEADEDGDAHIYIAPGVMPHWLGDGESIGVADAATIFGQNFGYRLTHHLDRSPRRNQHHRSLRRRMCALFTPAVSAAAFSPSLRTVIRFGCRTATCSFLAEPRPRR